MAVPRATQTNPTAQAGSYLVQLMLLQWRLNVMHLMRSKVDSKEAVAQMIRIPFDDITGWAESRLTNGFMES